MITFDAAFASSRDAPRPQRPRPPLQFAPRSMISPLCLAALGAAANLRSIVFASLPRLPILSQEHRLSKHCRPPRCDGLDDAAELAASWTSHS